MNIIELAREAHGAMLSSGKGMNVWHNDAYVGDVQEFCERFAALVRAAALEEAAGVCEEVHNRYPTDIFPDGKSVTAQSAKMARITANNCAAVIRALKEKK